MHNKKAVMDTTSEYDLLIACQFFMCGFCVVVCWKRPEKPIECVEFYAFPVLQANQRNECVVFEKQTQQTHACVSGGMARTMDFKLAMTVVVMRMTSYLKDLGG